MLKFLRLLATTVALTMAFAGPAKAQSILEKIATEVLAAKFGINTADITRVQSASGLSVYDLAPIFSASSATRTNADTVWKLRQQGLGWGQVAHRIGMQPGKFNKLRKAGAFDSSRIWSGALSSRFAVPTTQVVAVQRRGATPKDIIAAILIAKATKRSPQAVFDEYRRSRDWEPIRTKYEVDFENWRKYTAKPHPKVRSALGVTPGKAKGHAVNPPGKAKGHGGPPPGHGKGNDKGQGKGKGHDKGRGGT